MSEEEKREENWIIERRRKVELRGSGRRENKRRDEMRQRVRS